MILKYYKLIMDSRYNALSNLPVSTRFQLMSVLSWMWSAMFSVGIGSYYAVLMGWTLDTLLHSIFFGLPGNLAEAETFFGSISSGSSVLLGQIVSLLLTAMVVAAGIRGVP